MFKTRFYNQVSLKNWIISKTSTRERIETEYNRFTYAKEIIPTHIPKVYGVDKKTWVLSMEYIQQWSLYECITKWSLQIDRSLLLKINEIFLLMKKQTCTVSIAQKKEDSTYMYMNKVLDAISIFKSKHTVYDNINGQKIVHPEIILPQLYDLLYKKTDNNPYTFIHWDFTLSNILLGEDWKLLLIDPRGKFWNTHHYWDHLYDIAKIYYSVFGSFDSLNHWNITYDVSKNQVTYTIQQLWEEALKKDFFEIFWVNKHIIEYIHASIRLSLTPHIQDPIQSQTAYYHWTYLMNNLLNHYDNE